MRLATEVGVADILGSQLLYFLRHKIISDEDTEISSVLASAHRMRRVASLQLAYECASLVEAARYAGIPICVLKGVVLDSVYPPHIARSKADIDLLVDPEYMVPFCDLLVSRGYRKGFYRSSGKVVPSCDEFEDFRRQYCPHGDSYIFLRRGIPVRNIDVHRRINTGCDPYHSPSRLLIDRLQMIRHREFCVPSLSMIDTLISLCMHLERHEFVSQIRQRADASLKHSVDLAMYIYANRQLLRPVNVREYARQTHAEDLVKFCLNQVCALFPLNDVGICRDSTVAKRDGRYGKVIRHPWLTLDWRGVGLWSSDYITRIFDPSRYREFESVDHTLREIEAMMGYQDLYEDEGMIRGPYPRNWRQ